MEWATQRFELRPDLPRWAYSIHADERCPGWL